jgi:hypothetical protein
MQAPHPPQKKTVQKSKVWSKETFFENWAANGFFLGSPKIVGSP